MRALLLPRYTRDAASSRHRFYNARPFLTAEGIDCTTAPFFDHDYLASRFGKRRPYASSVIQSYLRRTRLLRRARNYELLFIQAEVFPYIPAAVELSLMPKGVPRVYDYDDAWFHRYDHHKNPLFRTLGAKISRLMEQSSAVVVGSSYLHDYAAHFCKEIYSAPTSIDLEHYPPIQPVSTGGPFTVGWIGSPSTSEFLAMVAGVLSEFCSRHDVRVVLVGADDRALNIPNVVRVPWSESTEVGEISGFDVGIMPLPDTPFARGKCAFKLIQYMGCWKPVVASPVGENAILVEPGRNGFLTNTPEEWLSALEVLHRDRSLCQVMGQQGRAKVESEYTLQVVAPRLASFLRSAADRGGIAGGTT